MIKYNYIGIDSGSTMCKAVLFNGKDIIDKYITKTGWNPKTSALESLEALLERNSLSCDDVYISVTGYGRESIDFADSIFTEITCHALGGVYLMPNIQGIIDIGGQDSKVIQIQNKKVVNFLMNDKCAAGTGRFLSMACEIIGIQLTDIDTFTNFDESICINSMCAVFAESEIIGLISMQKDRSKIMAGVLQSISQKIRQMTYKFDFVVNAPLLMTGGLSRSTVLIRSISESTELNIITHNNSLFAGAIGACICICNQNK